MKHDPVNPMAAYKSVMDSALDIMRPERMLEEQIQHIMAPTSALDHLNALDLTGERALARAAEQWREQFTHSIVGWAAGYRLYEPVH